MERNQTVLIVIVAVIAIAVASSAYLDKRDITEASPIEGNWELTTVYGYNTNGEYIKDVSSVNYFGKPLDIDRMALNVLGCTENLFHAKFLDMQICGEFLNEEVYFEFDTAEHHIVFYGFKNGNMMNVSFVCFFTNDGSGLRGTSYALHCQYIKGGSSPGDGSLTGAAGLQISSAREFDELKGVKMKVDSATVSYGSEGYQDLAAAGKGQTMQIDNIEGMAFSGRMDQVIADADIKKDQITNVSLAGVITEISNGQIFCSVMDDTGKYWLLSMYNKEEAGTKKWAISMRTTDVCDTVESWGQPCAIARNYFIGEPDYSLFPNFADYSNSKWMCTEGIMMQGTGKFLKVNVMMEMRILDQRNSTMHMRALMANMFGGDMVGLVVQSGQAIEIDVYFFDDLGRQYAAYLTTDPENPNQMWMTSTYLVNKETGGAFRLLFQRVG